MDQSLVRTFSWGNSYGPMVLKVQLKFPPALALVHGWLFLATPPPIDEIKFMRIFLRRNGFSKLRGLWLFPRKLKASRFPGVGMGARVSLRILTGSGSKFNCTKHPSLDIKNVIVLPYTKM